MNADHIFLMSISMPRSAKPVENMISSITRDCNFFSFGTCVQHFNDANVAAICSVRRDREKLSLLTFVRKAYSTNQNPELTVPSQDVNPTSI